MGLLNLSAIANAAYYTKGYYTAQGTVVTLGWCERTVRELFWWLPLESSTTKCLRLSLELLSVQLRQDFTVAGVEAAARNLAEFDMLIITPYSCLWAVRGRIDACRNQALKKLYPFDQRRMYLAEQERSRAVEEFRKADEALIKAQEKVKESDGTIAQLKKDMQFVVERLQKIEEEYAKKSSAKTDDPLIKENEQLKQAFEAQAAEIEARRKEKERLLDERGRLLKEKALLQEQLTTKTEEYERQKKHSEDLAQDVARLKAMSSSSSTPTGLPSPLLSPTAPGSPGPSFAFPLIKPGPSPDKTAPGGSGSIPRDSAEESKQKAEEARTAFEAEFETTPNILSRDKGNGKIVFVTYRPGDESRSKVAFDAIKEGFKRGDYIIYPESWKKGAYSLTDIQVTLKLDKNDKKSYVDTDADLKNYQDHLAAYRTKMKAVLAALSKIASVPSSITVDGLKKLAVEEMGKIVDSTPEREAFKKEWLESEAMFKKLPLENERIVKRLEAEGASIKVKLQEVAKAKVERRIIIIVNQCLLTPDQITQWAELFPKDSAVVPAFVRHKVFLVTLASLLQETIS